MPPLKARPRPAHLLLVGLGLCLLLSAVATPSPAEATGSAAGTLLASIDDARAARGLPPLAPAGDLEAVATAHSRSMAESGDLHHNPALGQEVANWRVVAENVGRGSDADVLHDMFMDSPTHATNILDERVTQVGIGVVTTDDGQLWVTQVFRQPRGTSTPEPAPPSAAPPSPTPSSNPTPDPAVAPPPDPTSEPPVPVVGVAAATTTRTAPAPAAIGVAAATVTTTAPAPVEDDGGLGLLAAAARWVASLF